MTPFFHINGNNYAEIDKTPQELTGTTCKWMQKRVTYEASGPGSWRRFFGIQRTL